ncbi:MAG: hypothetical protein IKQ56_09105 [Lachnospiraceae bacterium]|nr:hypothetical protein [Lachnospiraceae bacterium]
MKYSDDGIRNASKVTLQMAGAYLGISPNAIAMGVRLIAYKYGRINEIQVDNIEKNLSTIIQKFEEVKQDISFLLSENADLRN